MQNTQAKCAGTDARAKAAAGINFLDDKIDQGTRNFE
jgi:hypothetical protein